MKTPGRELAFMQGLHFFTGQEQEFKTACGHRLSGPSYRVFEVENEEKEAGFPDALEMAPCALGERSLSRLVEYKVKLDRFEGPLDLLLYLIKKEEINVYDIPIAQITRR